MRLDNYLFFMLDYKRDDKNEARVVKIHKNTNLLCLYDKENGFGKITNDLGDIALLNCVTLASHETYANDLAKLWNNVYKKENRFFGGN